MSQVAISSSYKQLGTDYVWTTVMGKPSQSKRPPAILPKHTLPTLILSSERPGFDLSGGQPFAKPRRDSFARQSDLLLSALASQPAQQKLYALSHAPYLSAFSFPTEAPAIPAEQQHSWPKETATPATRGKASVPDPGRPNHDQNGVAIVKDEPFCYQVLEEEDVISERPVQQAQPLQHVQPVQPAQIQGQHQLQPFSSDQLPSWLASGLPEPATTSSTHHQWRRPKSAVQKKVDHANRERNRVRERRRLLNELTNLVPELQVVSQSKIPGERKHGLSTVEVLRAACAYIHSIHNGARPAAAAAAATTTQDAGGVPEGATAPTFIAAPAFITAAARQRSGDEWIGDGGNGVAMAAADAAALACSGVAAEQYANDSGFTGSPSEPPCPSHESASPASLQPSPEATADVSSLAYYADVSVDVDGNASPAATDDWLERYREEWDPVALASPRMPFNLTVSVESEFGHFFGEQDVPGCPAEPVLGAAFIDGRVAPGFGDAVVRGSAEAAAAAGGDSQDESPRSPSYNFGHLEWYDGGAGHRGVDGMMQLADLEEAVRCECPEECHPEA